MADKPFPASGPAPAHGQPSPHGSDAKHVTGEVAAAAVPPRAMGQRSSEARDAMAEMAERAQLISQEAGTKIAAAMKDVIGAAAGIAGFAVESARDLVQYMVRRGQITQDEADKLIRQAEEAHGRTSHASAAKPSGERSMGEPKPAASSVKRASGATAAAKPEKKAAARPSTPAKKSATKPSAPKKKR